MSDFEFSDDPNLWTVHVLGPDDVHTFPNADEALAFIRKSMCDLAVMYPRASEYYPLLRLVVTPPTAVVPPTTDGEGKR